MTTSMSGMSGISEQMMKNCPLPGMLNSSDHLVDGIGFSSWPNHEARSSVNNSCAAPVAANSILANLHPIHGNLPVSLPLNWHISHLALIEKWVRSAQNQLPSQAILRVPVQPERKDRLLDNSLIDHIVEDRGDSQDRDLREAHPKDTVKSGSNKRNARFMSCLSKSLVIDTHPSNAASIC